LLKKKKKLIEVRVLADKTKRGKNLLDQELAVGPRERTRKEKPDMLA